MGHFDDGKEEYESNKDTPRRYSDVTKSAFSIYQKSFSQSWIVCFLVGTVNRVVILSFGGDICINILPQISPKDAQRLRGTLSLQVAATVIAQYGPDPGSEVLLQCVLTWSEFFIFCRMIKKYSNILIQRRKMELKGN